MATDWEGRQIPADEPDDKLIHIWVITPHPQTGKGYDEMWERSWQSMLGIVKDSLESLLESREQEDLLDPDNKLTISFSLQKVTKAHYEEVVSREY